MASLVQFNDSLRSLIKQVLQMPDGSVRPANLNAPVGDQQEPFATVLITSLVCESHANHKLASSDGVNVEEALWTPMRASVSIQFFRAGAMDNAQQLAMALQSAAAIKLLHTMNVGVGRISPINNLTAVVDTFFEERSQVDVDFNLFAFRRSSLPNFKDLSFQVGSESVTTTNEVILP